MTIERTADGRYVLDEEALHRYLDRTARIEELERERDEFKNAQTVFRIAADADKARIEELERDEPMHHGRRAECDACQAEVARIEELEAALRDIEPVQQRVLEMLRREGFKFETPLHLSDGWEKLAFTLYSTICETDAIVVQALAKETE